MVEKWLLFSGIYIKTMALSNPNKPRSKGVTVVH